MPQTYIGCDISKDRLDVFDPDVGHASAHANSATGIKALFKACGPDAVLIFEATSGCDRALLKACAAAKQPFVRLNPLHAWHFAQSLNLPKTDRVDARMLACAGAHCPGPGAAPGAAFGEGGEGGSVAGGAGGVAGAVQAAEGFAARGGY